MAHFAKLNSDNIVVKIHKVANEAILDSNNIESESKGQEVLNSLHGDGSWVQCSYNGSIRKKYPSIGDKYDSTRDAFIGPKPYNSWVLNETTCIWEPPVAYPSNALAHEIWGWNENNQEWQKLI